MTPKKPLEKYLKKRDLKKSREPSKTASKKTSSHPIFVIQKHEARRLHYDLRLEIEGTLKSWAIPKIPTQNPEIKRLAIHVEDHPMDYGKFEGVIPKGNYGAGRVAIWDKGTVACSSQNSSLSKEYRKGEMKIVLSGEKLKGNFVLVKLKKEENHWLFFKLRDEFADAEDQGTEEESNDSQLYFLSGVKKKMPHHIKPMLASKTDKPFDDKKWLFEIKWDGYRALSEITSQKVLLYSRNLQSFSARFPSLVKELQQFKKQLIVDGEIVVLNSEGKADFQLLQHYSETDPSALRYFLFDILYCDGRDLRDIPLIQRKQILKNEIEALASSCILFSDHIEEKGKKFFQEIEKEKMEGLIAKKLDSVYISKRSTSWLKIPSHQREEVIICGYTQPRSGRKRFSSLLVGTYKNKVLTFAGHIGTGFSEAGLDYIYSLLQPIIIDHCPFKQTPKTNTPPTWVDPKIVCQVEYKERTKGGLMRQPSFKGLREDKPPRSVHEEHTTPRPKLQKSPSKAHISNPDKIFWPKEKYTKKDLLNYYESISSTILPYLKGRPQVLLRHPDGIKGNYFYQKKAPEFIPDWIETTLIKHTKGQVEYVLINDLKSLLYIVNLGCIELHPFSSRLPNIDFPDFLILDLDPEAVSFNKVIDTAQIIHRILEDASVAHFCKTSGKRGLHILVPLGQRYSFKQTQSFAHLLAQLTHREYPTATSLTRDPKKRQRKVYIDYLQNSRTKTIAAPYSLRAVDKAQVSAPLLWEEVKHGLSPNHFTLSTMLERIKEIGDPFKPLLKTTLDMEKAIAKLEKLL